MKNPKYIVPVHVGSFDKGVLTKFFDFNPMLYPDSITAILPAPPTAMQEKAAIALSSKSNNESSTPTAAAADDGNDADEINNDEGGGEGDEEFENRASCQKCQQALHLMPEGTWKNWSCDWPGHDGDAHGLKSADP